MYFSIHLSIICLFCVVFVHFCFKMSRSELKKIKPTALALVIGLSHEIFYLLFFYQNNTSGPVKRI
jgi:hypothetical protein